MKGRPRCVFHRHLQGIHVEVVCSRYYEMYQLRAVKDEQDRSVIHWRVDCEGFYCFVGIRCVNRD